MYIYICIVCIYIYYTHYAYTYYTCSGFPKLQNCPPYFHQKYSFSAHRQPAGLAGLTRQGRVHWNGWFPTRLTSIFNVDKYRQDNRDIYINLTNQVTMYGMEHNWSYLNMMDGIYNQAQPFMPIQWDSQSPVPSNSPTLGESLRMRLHSPPTL